MVISGDPYYPEDRPRGARGQQVLPRGDEDPREADQGDPGGQVGHHRAHELPGKLIPLTSRRSLRQFCLFSPVGRRVPDRGLQVDPPRQERRHLPQRVHRDGGQGNGQNHEEAAGEKCCQIGLLLVFLSGHIVN